MSEGENGDIVYSVRRSEDGAFGSLRDVWSKRWVRWAAYLLAAAPVAILLIWVIFARDLPSADTLVDYEPDLPTMVRGVDGEIINTYARERRVQLQYKDYPVPLIRAFLSAEDKNFFSHNGLDYPGLASAVFDYVTKIGSGQRARGGSTITQQVAKNLLLGDEYSITRKVREAILAYRIEDVLTKQEILELYLNEIYLGRNAYGVQAAARAYFGKDVADLKLHEAAYLAILPKAPSNYRPEVHMERALERRNWALGAMQSNGWITQAQMAAAQAEPLGTIARTGDGFDKIGGYFVEEVRRQLVEQFGEKAEDGRNSVYAGGLWVRTSLNPEMQRATTEALRDALLRYDRGSGWAGPINTIEIDDQWASRLASTYIDIDYENWRVAVVIEKSGSAAEIGFANGTKGVLPRSTATMPRKRVGGTAFDSMKPGDIIAVSPIAGDNYALRNVPEISGGMVVQNPRSGRVYAMQGGFDSQISPFNRATQADRQPGSTIKPFVYATALDNGMTPATQIVDGTFCVYQSASLGNKCFRNFGGSAGAGAQTMRWGLEQSRNLMTVRAANDAGMTNVVKTIKAVGIGDYKPYLSIALGAGDTTVMKITNAYSMLVNHGRELKPTMIDYVQDRRGKVIFRSDPRTCEGCNMAKWDGRPMPRFTPRGRQIVDPITSYQVVHMLEGVITRGTATNLADLDRPMFGKTGTSSGPTNVWFVGGTPDMVAGIYLGFDQPRSMGGYAQGGRLAAPVFKQFAKQVLPSMPITEFRAPAGTRMVRIDRRSGRRVYGAWPGDEAKAGVIWEAFKPETEPRRTIRQEEMAAAKAVQKRTGPAAQARSDSEFLQQQGGIY
ncbi:penicillin-binding protein 1A [Blastomonas aquatica]|uniref:Penicillin-binding protein 1A n=1 Tax=Blastomonas aquatica TaxID=1510276 RepID=A0ABQ1JAE8_9SPHN|nr:PBP1A family penicillin-binding protein [Blastomonas aquatica]GGB63523.1 penicillin-binding protein [Blastomonas aquatica]